MVENPDGSVVVEGINKPLVATEEQIREHLERGDKLRSTAATNMNEHVMTRTGGTQETLDFELQVKIDPVCNRPERNIA